MATGRGTARLKTDPSKMKSGIQSRHAVTERENSCALPGSGRRTERRGPGEGWETASVQEPRAQHSFRKRESPVGTGRERNARRKFQCRDK